MPGTRKGRKHHSFGFDCLDTSSPFLQKNNLMSRQNQVRAASTAVEGSATNGHPKKPTAEQLQRYHEACVLFAENVLSLDRPEVQDALVAALFEATQAPNKTIVTEPRCAALYDAYLIFSQHADAVMQTRPLELGGVYYQRSIS